MAKAWQWGAAALLWAGLVGCGATYDPVSFVNTTLTKDTTALDDAAIAAEAKGDYQRAEALASEARTHQPNDPYAQLTLARIYERTNRPDLARQFYGALVSQNPQATIVTGSGAQAVPRAIADIARERYAALTGPPPDMTPPAVRAAALGVAQDGYVIERFRALRTLLNDGLISREEYDRRRGANLGALLPYVAPPPAAGLGLPGPSTDEVVSRLRALATMYQHKGISADAMAAERDAILEALMPAHPERRADRPWPIANSMQEAAEVGRVQRLLDAKAITTAEAERERRAAAQSLADSRAAALAAARAAAAQASAPPSPKGDGVWLGTYRSNELATRAWTTLHARYPKQLDSLLPVVEQVTVRKRRYWRLTAGPVKDRKAASALCRVLRRHRQTCQPTVIR